MSRNYGTSSGNHSFSSIEAPSIPRSSFNRSSGLKQTFSANWLLPIWCDEALPGDTFNMNATIFARRATPLHPVMDNMYIETFWFAVPIRLVWENWHKFNGAQDNPGDSTTFLIPQMVASATGVVGGTLSDYLGIPPGVHDLSFSSLWHRSYNLIYNEWFRPEDIRNSITVDTDDGPDTESDYVLRKRFKRHDYFTSCLPWPQKGTSVQLPLGTSAKIHFQGDDPGGGAVPNIYDDTAAASTDLDTTTAGNPILAAGTTSDADNFLYADLSTATAATINELREAFQIQRIYERDARGGTRLTEIIKSHFGVTSPDARLQRPEFLGGGRQRVDISTVPQTSTTAGVDSDEQLGGLGAYGVSAGSGHGFVKSFTEHCLLIGLINAYADVTYQSGLHRMFSRRTRWDFYWPAFQSLGEQAVLSREIFARGSEGDNWVSQADQGEDETVFGYQERWSEYRYAPSRLTTQFRSGHTNTLDTWHLAEDLGDPAGDNAPTLNTAFLEMASPIGRSNAVASEPDFIGDFFFNLTCARPMPTYSIPGMIDHF